MHVLPAHPGADRSAIDGKIVNIVSFFLASSEYAGEAYYYVLLKKKRDDDGADRNYSKLRASPYVS